MKKITLLCFSACLLSIGNGAFAQSNNNTLDERAKKYYSEEQIKSFTPEKIKQINFYYSKSFVILKKDVCASCPAIDASTIDVTKFESSRAEDRRVVVFLTKPGHPIELLSWNEIKAEYAKLGGK